jgi:hypothetical protein
MNSCPCRREKCPFGYGICHPARSNESLNEIIHPRMPQPGRLPGGKRALASFARHLPRRFFTSPPQI